MHQPNRLPPKLPVEAVKTFKVSAPLETHWRPASCAEVDCPRHINGWRTTVDESTDLGQQQAHYIRHDRTRRHVESRQPGGLTEFTFESGQTCFMAHKTPLERPALYVVRGGDWRGNPRGEVRRHTRPDNWVDEFANHQQRIADEIEKG